MILAIMVFTLGVGVFVALAAWLVDKALAHLGRPRRAAWITGIAVALLLPVWAVVSAEPASVSSPSPVLAVDSASTAFMHGVRPRIAELSGARVGTWSLDEAAALAWALLSIIAMLYYFLSVRRLSRNSRAWRKMHIESRPVLVAPDVGPAAFGWRRPRMIIPAWLLSAPEKFQRLALAHEAQHITARDPQVLAVFTILGMLLPWNLAVSWMLHRLRFAIEVDCDARVLRSGADAGDYGMALLYVSERQSHAPAATIALIERTSQLERRIAIMFSSPRRFAVLAATTCLALACTCIVAAATLDAPNTGAASPAVLKPPPGKESMGFKLGQHFEQHIRETYPELMGGNFEGMPIIVALMNDDWSVARSAKTMNPDPKGDVQATNALFGLIGIPPQDAPYVGAMHMQMTPDKFVVMVYTERKRSGKRFVSRIFPDTRQQDRELFEHNFPDVGLPAAGQNPWLLLDRSGKVLRKGIEPLTPDWNETLEQRFAGIDTQEVTVTSITDAAGEPIRDVAGNELHLHSVWLAPGSPLPSN